MSVKEGISPSVPVLYTCNSLLTVEHTLIDCVDFGIILSLTYSLTSRPSSMTVGDSR